MKLLRNPIVTCVLALAAVLIVFYQFGGAKLFRGKRVQHQVTKTATPRTAPVPTSQPLRAAQARAAAVAQALTTTNLPAALLPERPVDETFVGPRFANWVKAPLRDPFLLLTPVIEEPGLFESETNSPVRTWTLKAIWNQTDSRLAVINNRIYRVGDVVQEGYKLVRIEKDEVWFQGPMRNERLGFPEKKRATTPGQGKTPAKNSEGKSVSRKA